MQVYKRPEDTVTRRVSAAVAAANTPSPQTGVGTTSPPATTAARQSPRREEPMVIPLSTITATPQTASRTSASPHNDEPMVIPLSTITAYPQTASSAAASGADSYAAIDERRMKELYLAQAKEELATRKTELDRLYSNIMAADSMTRGLQSNLSSLSEDNVYEQARLQSQLTDLEYDREYARQAYTEADTRFSILHDEVYELETLLELEDLSEPVRAAFEDYYEHSDTLGYSSRKICNDSLAYLQAHGYTQEDLDRWMDVTERIRNAEYAQQKREDFAKFSDENPALAEIASLGSNFIGSITSFAEAAGSTLERTFGLTEYERPDPNKKGYLLNDFTRISRDTVSRKLLGDENSSELRKGVGKALDVANKIFLGIGDGTISLATGGGAGSLALAGMGSFGSTYQNIAANGGSYEQALSMSLISAGLEMGTEKLSLDGLLELKTPQNTAQFFKNTFLHGITGVTEEELKLLGTFAYEAATLGDKSSYNLRVAELMENGNMTKSDAEDQATKELIWQFTETALVSFGTNLGMSAGKAALDSVTSHRAQTRQNPLADAQSILGAENLTSAERNALQTYQTSLQNLQSLQQQRTQLDSQLQQATGNPATRQKLQNQLRSLDADIAAAEKGIYSAEHSHTLSQLSEKAKNAARQAEEPDLSKKDADNQTNVLEKRHKTDILNNIPAFSNLDHQTKVVFSKKEVYQGSLFDHDPKTAQGARNRERMRRGKAPLGWDNQPVNLHHLDQTNDGPLMEILQSVHRKYFKELHSNTGQKPSLIDRNQFSRWRNPYWKWRNDNLNDSQNNDVREHTERSE